MAKCLTEYQAYQLGTTLDNDYITNKGCTRSRAVEYGCYVSIYENNRLVTDSTCKADEEYTYFEYYVEGGVVNPTNYGRLTVSSYVELENPKEHTSTTKATYFYQTIDYNNLTGYNGTKSDDYVERIRDGLQMDTVLTIHTLYLDFTNNPRTLSYTLNMKYGTDINSLRTYEVTRENKNVQILGINEDLDVPLKIHLGDIGVMIWQLTINE